MTWDVILESRVVQAVLAGGFLALGWVFNGRQNRREAARLRAEKLRDFHRAIYAEIASYMENLGSSEALEAYRMDIVAKMEADESYVPLIPRENNDTIFSALIAEISILPRVTIDPIVIYYNQITAIEELIQDLRGERFADLSVERRVRMYQDYIGLKLQAFEDGHYALRMIAAFAAGGRDGALEEEARIAKELSIPDVDQSDQSQGSASGVGSSDHTS
ncbi:MAG: hypothetical protein ABJF50_23435 [Paracoccaceae bacterium]|uniref:hypothetical protein n=1 Tax=Parasphingorhabdus sp. TaxID=2709688 RepID=UPI00326D96F9